MSDTVLPRIGCSGSLGDTMGSLVVPLERKRVDLDQSGAVKRKQSIFGPAWTLIAAPTEPDEVSPFRPMVKCALTISSLMVVDR
jgi:hypothetical protein